MAFRVRSLAGLSKNLKKNVSKITTILTNKKHFDSSFFNNIKKLLLPSRLSTTHSFKELLNNVPETRVTTLANGLRVATEDYGLPTATVIF